LGPLMVHFISAKGKKRKRINSLTYWEKRRDLGGRVAGGNLQREEGQAQKVSSKPLVFRGEMGGGG